MFLFLENLFNRKGETEKKKNIQLTKEKNSKNKITIKRGPKKTNDYYTNSMKHASWAPIRARTSIISFLVCQICDIDHDIWRPNHWTLSLILFLKFQGVVSRSLNQIITLAESDSIKNWLDEDQRETTAMKRPSRIT